MMVYDIFLETKCIFPCLSSIMAPGKMGVFSSFNPLDLGYDSLTHLYGFWSTTNEKSKPRWNKGAKNGGIRLWLLGLLGLFKI